MTEGSVVLLQMTRLTDRVMDKQIPVCNIAFCNSSYTKIKLKPLLLKLLLHFIPCVIIQQKSSFVDYLDPAVLSEQLASERQSRVESVQGLDSVDQRRITAAI